jgi:HemY protein
VASGQVKQARKLAGKAEKLLGDPHLTRLLSAQTAQLTGDRDGQRAHFEAMRERPETALLGWRGLLDLALQAGQREEAIILAQGARRLAPDDAVLAEQLFGLLMASGQLAEASELILDAGRRKAMSREQVARRRALVLNERARRAERDGDGKDALAFAKQAVAADPGLADAALRLARLQAGQGLTRQAAATLEKSWRAAPLPALAEAYQALIPGEPPLQRLRRLEKLAASHPDAEITHRVMGEAALAAKLWGQARKHLTAARPTASLLGLLSKLEIAEYKDHKAAQAWLASVPVADPAWVCGDCGRRSADWELLCPQCGSIDRLAWSDGTVDTAEAPRR